MKLPKRGEKGFTLIELLIVVAILGVLAAVIIPNVGRFIGAGEEESQKTELSNIQTAVISMMVDNQLSVLPAGTFITTGSETNDMGAFPSSAVCGTDKLIDPDGNDYTVAQDKDGYILYQHDIIGDTAQTGLVNYVATQTTAYWYFVDADGTVHQELSAP